MKHSHKLSLTALICLTGLSVVSLAADSVTPDAALAKLKAGNARFAAATVTEGKSAAAARAATAKSQHPFAIVVGCSDSRTAPELVFDQGIGDLFVVRNAGDLTDNHVLGSIEYAVHHLGSRLIVVMGHDRCGAVQAAVAGGKVPGYLKSVVRGIRPSVKAARRQPGDLLDNAIANNARHVAHEIRTKAKFGELRHEVRVVVGIYHLDSGKISWIEA